MYKQLGLTLTQYDTTNHIITGERLRSRHDFGGKSLPDLVDCGETAGIPNAMRYDVNLRVTSQVLPAENATTTIRTQADAMAKADATSGDLISCQAKDAIADVVASAMKSAVQ